MCEYEVHWIVFYVCMALYAASLGLVEYALFADRNIERSDKYGVSGIYLCLLALLTAFTTKLLL